MADNNNGCCIYEAVIEELQKTCERNEKQMRELSERINAHETAIAISTERYTNLLNAFNRLEQSFTSSLNNINEKLEEISQKPAKKWDNMTGHITAVVISLVLGFLFSYVFK